MTVRTRRTAIIINEVELSVYKTITPHKCSLERILAEQLSPAPLPVSQLASYSWCPEVNTLERMVFVLISLPDQMRVSVFTWKETTVKMS